MSKRVTMKDIADRAGVSAMTVSLALRNSPRISIKTRARIKELVDTMGFRPDPALGALVAYRTSQKTALFTGTIAYLNNTDLPTIVDVPGLHQNFFAGAKARGAELGYQLEEFWLNSPGMSVKRASDILTARSIQGILVGPQPIAHGSLNLVWERFTAIRLGHSLDSPKLHTVAANQYMSINLGFRELCALGYRRIGLAIASEQDERTQNRYTAAYLAMQHKLPADLPRIPIFMGDHSFEDFRTWMETWRPDAIIGPRGEALSYLRRLKIVPGQDVGFVFPFRVGEGLRQFACCGVRQSLIGHAAMDYLNGLLLQNQRGIPELPTSMMLDPTWEPRETVRTVGPPLQVGLF